MALETMVPAGKAFGSQVWGENPIFRQVLGICSALAVTNLVFNTILMCGGLIWATTLSAVTISVMRHYIPTRVRMIVQVLIIAVYVIMVDIAIRAWYPQIHSVIGPYVGLIITNCIIMGRLEAFSSKNRVWSSFWDGLGSGVGYSMILLLVAVIREALGFGTIMKMPLPMRASWWHSWTIMVMAPGAFFVLALMVWAARSYSMRLEARAQAVKAAQSAARSASAAASGEGAET